jgi:hypothetical protein
MSDISGRETHLQNDARNQPSFVNLLLIYCIVVLSVSGIVVRKEISVQAVDWLWNTVNWLPPSKAYPD